MDSFWADAPPPGNWLKGVAGNGCRVRRQGSCGGWVATLLTPLGGAGVDVAFIAATGGVLEVSPPLGMFVQTMVRI
jgi:hypothetical protein